MLLLWEGSRLTRNLTSRWATSPCRMLGMLWRSSSSCFLFRPQMFGLLTTRKAGYRPRCPTASQPADVPDGRPVNGAHGGGKGSVQRVVENRRADVGHDGVQQRLAQVLLLGGHRRRRGLKAQAGLLRAHPSPGLGPGALLARRKELKGRLLTTAMSFFSFSSAISHFCSVFRGHLWTRSTGFTARTSEDGADAASGVTWWWDRSGCSAGSSSCSGPSSGLFRNTASAGEPARAPTCAPTLVLVDLVDHPAQRFDVFGELFQLLHVLLVLQRRGPSGTHD